MRVRKESGGTTINWRRVNYEWPDDGSVADVPVELAIELLAIRGGGFSEAPEPEPETEPETENESGETDPSGDGDGGGSEPESDAKPKRASRKAAASDE